MLMTDALSSQKPLVPNTLNTGANLALKPSSELDLYKVSLALECQEDTRHITYPSANATDSPTICRPDNETRQGTKGKAQER